MSSIKVIIGLGNPGHAYAKTRHNIGFCVLDVLADKYGGSWQLQNNLEKSTILMDGKTLLLVKPQTYMNKSGEVVPFLKKQGIQAENILVVHDELEKPFGKVAIKQSGSARGHNGLRSLIQAIGPDFYRVRVGIGRPENREDVGTFVLENFSEPRDAVEKLILDAVRLIEDFV